MHGRDLAELEGLIGYTFEDPDLLGTALIHRSWANEHRELGLADNEKLEFLGDAVVGLVISQMLMESQPQLDEGRLSVTRAQVVSESGLSEAAAELGLGRFLRLGKGEERTGGRDKPSLLADTLEAVVAAVFLDGGFDAAQALVRRLFEERLERLDLAAVQDFKTSLQERSQALLKATPEYRVVSEEGPDHDKTFEVCVVIAGREWARATGKSKKAAEQHAAAKAVASLEEA